MKNEYIIVDKTVLENRIQELEKDLEDEPNPFLNTSYQSELDVLKKILSQSTPLIPGLKSKTSNVAKQKSIDYVMKWMYYAAWSWKDHELTTDQYLEGVRKIDEEMRKMHEIEIAAAYANGYNDRSDELDFSVPDSEMESLLEQGKQYYREHFELDRNKTTERVPTNETFNNGKEAE